MISHTSSTAHILITGVGGFMGSYLAKLLLEQGWEVVGTVRPGSPAVPYLPEGVRLLPCDITDRKQVEEIVAKACPTVVFHLAGQTLPSASWRDPDASFRTNAVGTAWVLEAIRQAAQGATVIVAGSSAEYGPSMTGGGPVTEDSPLRPFSPYGVSKVAADLLGDLYRRAFGLKVICVRPFWIIGPRKTGDVCSDFARGIAAVERGQQPYLSVGNLEAVRDFLDVQDAVRALKLLAEHGTPGSVYNICAGVGHKVQEVLDIMLSLASKPVPVQRDPSRMRPADEPVVIGDNSKLRALGWKPTVPIEESLKAILSYWRALS